MSTRTCGNRVVVIGGGPAGLLCAGTLTDAGCTVTVLERSGTLGGLMKSHQWYYPDSANLRVIRTTMMESNHVYPGMSLHTEANITGVAGQAGRFAVAYAAGGASGQEIQADMIVLATGFDVRDVTDTGTDGVGSGQSAVLVCQEQNKGAFAALAARALHLRTGHGCETVLITPDVKVAGTGLERLMNQAQDAGVIVIKSDDTVITGTGGASTVRVTDPVLNRTLIFEPDVLITGGYRMPAAGTAELARMLRIDTGPGGFLQADNSQNGSVETGRPGVFVCGGCRYPGDGEDIVRDCGAVAARVAALAGTELTSVPGVSRIDAEKCRLCLTCYRTCPHAAVDIDDDEKSAVIDEAVCAACGTCIGACPAGAIAEVPA